ncbi:hypothetical protein VPH35_057235 [Triticum aestivum]
MSDEITNSSSSLPAPASPLDNDDLLEEILLRLPPKQSSLRHVSAVCKRWRGLVADPRFFCRWKPPLLGALVCGDKETVFTPILDPPEGTPLERFDLGHCSRRRHYCVLDCRHSRVLVKDLWRKEIVVCEPIRGEQHHVPIPPAFNRTSGHLNGVVLCAAAAHDHVHGSCPSSPYKVALMSMYKTDHRLVACVYSSETGIWGKYVSTSAPCAIFNAHIVGTLTGNTLHWLSMKDHILEFDLDRQTLAMIEGPQGLNDEPHKHRIIKAEDCDVGLFVLSENSIQLWQMKVNYQGITTWLLRNDAILEISPQIKRNKGRLLGYDEDIEAIFLHIHGGVYMVQLKSMQCKKLDESSHYTNYRYYPFKSFHAPGDCSSL